MKKHRKITSVKVKLREYNDSGQITKVRKVQMRLCVGENPQVFTIEIPDKRKTRFTEIIFSRRLVESIINSNWSPLKK